MLTGVVTGSRISFRSRFLFRHQSCFCQPLALAVFAVAGLLPATRAVAKDEKADVTVNYVLAPSKELPEGLKAVAVIDSGVETHGAKEADREKKWSQMAADMIESMLANSAARFGTGLQVVQRRKTKQILAEKDLQLAGLVDGPTAEKAGKLLAVQGLISSQITINIDTQRRSKSTMDWGGVMGAVAQGAASGLMNRHSPRTVIVQPQPVYHPRGAVAYADPRSRDPRMLRYRRYGYDNRYRPAGTTVVVTESAPPPIFAAPGFGTKEVEEISRSLTIQCSFTLIDAVTGQALVQFSPPPYQKLDKSSPDFLFGSMHQEDLDPVDHFIGELVEQAVQEFVSTMVPTEVEYKYEVVGKHKESELAVRAVRADDYDVAYDKFASEAQSKKDADEAVFALGVLSEMRGKFDQALNYYRRAASMNVKGDELAMYLSAKKRLTDHLPRIMKNPPTGAPLPQGAPPADSAASPSPRPDAAPASSQREKK